MQLSCIYILVIGRGLVCFSQGVETWFWGEVLGCELRHFVVGVGVCIGCGGKCAV